METVPTRHGISTQGMVMGMGMGMGIGTTLTGQRRCRRQQMEQNKEATEGQ